MEFGLQSEAFQAGAMMPKKYTGEGEDVSPPLKWSGTPAGTRELALICDDPDAPMEEPFVHWVFYRLLSNITELPEVIPKQGSVDRPVKLMQGTNSFGYTGYGGPMPPRGHGRHRYFFKLFALNIELSHLEPGVTKEQLLNAMSGHIHATTELMAIYERK